MPATVKLLRVLLLTEEFIWLNVLSMNREQFMNVDSVSVVVKVKLTDAVGEWVKATLIVGKIGWIPADQCERI